MSESVRLENVQNKERFSAATGNVSKEYIALAIQNVLVKVDLMMERFAEKFPFPASSGGRYERIENVEWTTSFWTGMLWLAYEYTGNNKYRILAEKHIVSFKERIERKGQDVQHHDLGFLYTLSCIAGYKLTGNQEAKTAAVEAADFLITRFLDKAGIIQAWGELTDPTQQGRMIIDCNLNLPLLYWTSDITKDDKYKLMAYRHVKNAQKYIVRPDASTFHTFYMDVETGEPKWGKTHQGKSNDSCWARGQAWGIYGFTLSYNYTKDESLLLLAKKLTNYFLNRLPRDLIPYWDLSCTDGSTDPRDSSSSAIVACGLLEMIKYLPITDPDRHFYEDAACALIVAMTEKYVSTNMEEDGILLHSTYALPQGVGIDEFCSWGDYYYFESLMRAYKTWNVYW